MLNVILLGLTSLLTDFSSEMVIPILPFFIEAIGGAGIAIGLAFGIGDAVAALLKVASGRWADKTKKYRAFVFWGYLFSAVSKFLYPLASNWREVLIIRPVERMGKGFRDAPRDAILSESLSPHQRGRGFGIQRAMDSVGAIIGSVFVLVLFLYLNLNFKDIFLISAFIALLALVPILFVKIPQSLRISQKSVSFAKLTERAKKFLAVATLFALANFSIAFFILKAQASFAHLDRKSSLALALVLYIFLNIFDAVFSAPAGSLSDRVGRRKVILTSYLMFSAVTGGFLLLSLLNLSSLWAFFFLLALFALYGLFRAFIDASQKALMSDLSPVEIRGTALGTFEALTGLAAIPAGLMAGLMWNVNQALPFVYGLALSLVAVIAFWKLVR